MTIDKLVFVVNGMDCQVNFEIPGNLIYFLDMISLVLCKKVLSVILLIASPALSIFGT